MKTETKFKQTEIGMIPSDWNAVELNNVAIVQTGKGTKNLDFGKYEIIGANGVIGYSNEFLESEDFIYTGRVGTIGLINYYSGKPVWISDNVLFIKNSSKVPLKFVYYALKRSNHSYLNVGSTQPLVKQSDLKKIKILIPKIPEEQKAIAKILSDLDSKIEILQEQNKTLEEIGKAIFKQWFIDFEFPNKEGKPYKSSGGKMVESELGDIPKGWDVSSLNEIADYLNGLALQKYPPKGKGDLPVIKIRELNQGITDKTDKANNQLSKEYIVENGTVLFSWSGSLMVKLWCQGRGALNQHLFKVTSKIYPKWFYYYWTNNHLKRFIRIASDKSTTMGHIQRTHLSEAKVIIPDESNLKKMSNIFKPLIKKLTSNGVEIKSLNKTRDSLLPKLMTGKIKVKVK